MKKINGVRRCRLCACEENYNNFFHIFDDNPELELEIKITKLLPIVVMPWDPMPHTVCSECINKLNSFNDFYEASIKAERFLRTLHPSVPETELENLDPVVEVMDSPALDKSPLKLPPKKRQGVSECIHEAKDVDVSSEFIEILETPNGGAEDGTFPKRTLNCFIINHITSRDSVFTCRKCFRTFTKQTSALTHSCVRIEDCGELETLDEDGQKLLPPLKIRLFSVKSGLFVCYLCQSQFENKTELVDHIKQHFMDGKWENEVKKKCGKGRGKRKSRGQSQETMEEEEEDDENGDWKESYKKKAPRRKRRKSSGPPKKRGRAKSGEGVDQCKNGMCKCANRSSVNSPIKETMEQTTQYSDVSGGSEGEIKIEDVESQVIENPAAEERANQEIAPISKPELYDNELRSKDDPVSNTDSKSDEVTILEVINNKVPTSFSSCVFCDKIFATKDALIIHQNKHLQGYVGLKAERSDITWPTDDETFLCSVCAMMFTSKKTLLDHEQFHLVDADAMESPRKIRIALGHDYIERDAEQECQPSKGRDIITITVTSTEKKVPQIEFLQG